MTDTNTGYWNTGYWNTGDRNTGNRNTGYWNTGDRNTGYWNTGDRNTGDRNTGNWNTGNWNTGNWNTGYGNTGNWNTGYGNSASRSSGIFCSQEPTIVIFNKDSGKKWGEIDHPHFNEFYLTKWVEYKDLTAIEKKENPTCETTRGLLKSFGYQEAWANFWKDTSEENRQKFLNLPNFDPRIFKEITGIDVANNNNSKKAAILKKIEELKKEADVFLDPAFWQALGKAMELVEDHFDGLCGTWDDTKMKKLYCWECLWHRFIEALTKGQSPEQFFNQF